MTHKIGEQIAEVRREIALRKGVYPRQVSAGKMKQKDADYHLSCIESVLKTLQCVQANEAEFRALLETKKVS